MVGRGIESIRPNDNGERIGEPKEGLAKSNIEVRLADLGKDRDIGAITAIFGQDSVIEHLAGIAPSVTPRNIKRFREELTELMPDVAVDPSEIIIATKKEIGDYLRAKDPSRSGVLIAESVGPNPEILGTIMVEKPGGAITIASVSKLAVSEEARGKGIGSALIKAATAVALCDTREGGWGYAGASAGIIVVTGSERPQRLFGRQGYQVQATRKNGCLGWANAQGLFVARDVLLVQLDSRNYTHDPNSLPKSL